MKTIENLTDLATAFKAESFPCNPVPFANAIVKLAEINGTNFIKSNTAKKLLIILFRQSYGQLCTIDLLKEYSKL